MPFCADFPATQKEEGDTAEATAITYFIWFFAAFQFLIAGWLISAPRPGPARIVHAILLILNGLTTFGLGWLNSEPYRSLYAAGHPDLTWLRLLISGTDVPTGAWLLVLVPIFWQGSGLDQARWTRTVKTGTLLATTTTLATILVSLVHPHWYRTTYFGYWVGEIPLVIAYGCLLFVLTHALTRTADRNARTTYAFLFIAFGTRVIEFTYRYTFGSLPATRSTPWTLRIDDLLYIPVGLLALALAIHIARTALRLPPSERGPLWATLTASAAALLFTIGYWDWAHDVTLYALSLLTLVLIRPLFIGLAYDPAWTLRSSGLLGIYAGLYLLLKALSAQILGTFFWTIGRTDLIALGIALLLAAPLRLRRSEFASRKESPNLTHAQRLAIYLLEAHRKDPGGPGVTTAEIQEALGITPNNVAGELRRAEKLLREHTEKETELVRAQLRGVRGRKFFHLTLHGAAAAQKVMLDASSGGSSKRR